MPTPPQSETALQSKSSAQSPSGAVESASNPVQEQPRGAEGGASVFLALLHSVNHEALLAKYRAVHGDQGRIELSNQFGRIFEQARVRAATQTDTFASYAPGSGYFTTGDADDAEGLAAAMIRFAAEQNSEIPNLELHKNIGAVIVKAPIPSASGKEAVDNFYAAHESVGVAEQMGRETAPGEIRVSDAVYQSLSPERRQAYEPVVGRSNRAARTAPIWSRKVAPAGAPDLPLTRAVMVIDMARFSRVQRAMNMFNRAHGSAALHDQIVAIIAEGFRRAGAASYEQYMNKWGGDGGIFFFSDPSLAHRVAVEVLKQAEEQQNKEARESSIEDALRCFRIGIDYGQLDGADRDGYSGEPLTRSERLESGGPSGEIRVSEEFYRQLGEDLRKAYGDKEPIYGKGHDQARGISGRRLAIADRAPWPEVGRDNKPFPAIRQPNSDFPAVEGAASATEPCFVICPLGDDQPRVADVFDQLISPACAKAGFTPRRATDVPGDRKAVIAENLWNAPLVVAYLGTPPHWNYNVILEVGIRLATGLPIILLSDGLDDGREPDYQGLLPFQIVHHNVITVPTHPSPKLIQRVVDEIGNSRAHASHAWESLNPSFEFRYTTFDDVVITDANETARRIFGAENVRKGQGIQRLRAFLMERTDPVQAAARSEEQMRILDALMVHAVRGNTAAKDWRPPKARIPIVFSNAPPRPRHR